MSAILTVIFIVVALLLGIALAYVPMRLLLGTMARNIKQFIQRQRERRQVPREGPDRRTQEPTVSAEVPPQ